MSFSCVKPPANVMAQVKFRSSKTSIMVPGTNADTPAQVAAQ